MFSKKLGKKELQRNYPYIKTQQIFVEDIIEGDISRGICIESDDQMVLMYTECFKHTLYHLSLSLYFNPFTDLFVDYKNAGIANASFSGSFNRPALVLDFDIYASSTACDIFDDEYNDSFKKIRQLEPHMLPFYDREYLKIIYTIKGE